MDAVSHIERGRASYASGAWIDADESLSLADRALPLGAEDLELLATSAYMLGRDDDYVSGLERAHHLYLDVNPESGAIKLNFPHLEVWEMAETCSLDVADRGGITLEEVGAILNLTRERIRQVEVRGLYKIRTQSGDELGDE